jgi:2-polyprenyl-6-methoxyphenol hydroxylase-like FAD-dependent oxidoreductase
MMSDTQVLIVGAGPVGLTAACELTRHGVDFRIVEKLAEPTTQSRAAAVQPRTLESLEPLGLSEELVQRGSPQRTFDVYGGRDGTRHLARFDMASIRSSYTFVLDIPQSETEAALRGCADRLGIVVERGVGVTGLVDAGDHVEAVLDTGETVTAAYVLGADGASSVVRHAMGLRLEGWADGEYAVYADVEVDMDLPYDSTTMITDHRGQRSVRPMGGKRARLSFPARELDLTVTPTIADVQALCDDMLDGRVRITEAHWLLHYRAHRGLAPTFRKGRMLLAGDAGHVHPPAGGQGMNTGIQDAVSVAWRLAMVTRGLAGEQLLTDYDTERHAVATDMVNGTSKLSQLMGGTGITALTRQAVLFLLGHVHRLNDLVATRAAQISIDYHDAGTVVGPEGRAGTHVAEHLRSSALVGSDLRVHVFGTEPFEGTVAGDPALGEALGLTAGIVVIRPDGYLGLVTESTDPAVLRDYLTRCVHLT